MQKIQIENVPEITRVLILIIISLGISFIFFGQNLKAEMGIIDDHSYIERGVLNNPHQVITNFINAPEIQKFGQSKRFRIIYWLINDSEAALFGFNPIYYYLTNICVFALFIFSVFYIVWKNIGLKWAVAFSIFVLIPPYFAHIFTRLGTAEIWTMLGLCIYALGYSSLFNKMQEYNNYTEWKEGLVMVIGALIAIGSKENFAIMFVLVISLLIFLKYYKKITKTVIVSSMIILLFNIYQIIYIFIMQSNQGVDLYQNDLNISYRISQIIHGSFSGYAIFFTILSITFLGVFVTFFVFLKIKNKFNKNIFEKIFLKTIIFFSVTVLIFYFNLYVYEGKFMVDGRYAFPAMFLFQILILIIVKWLYDCKITFFREYCVKHTNVYYIILIMGLVYILSITIQQSWILSEKNVEATTLFKDNLISLVYDINSANNAKVVFYSYDHGDYEAMRSVAKYLKYYGIKNKLMIKTNYNLKEQSALTESLKKQNLILQEKGGEGFIPYDDRAELNNCIIVNFNDEIIDGSNCHRIIKIWKFGNYPYSIDSSNFKYFLYNNDNYFVKKYLR